METKKISKRCPLHIEKWKDVYCHTCEQAICLRCMFENHRHHDCTELDMAARRKREILRRLARAIVELLSKLNGRRDDLIDVKSRACNLRDKVGKDVDVVLYTPGLRRRFADIMGVETDLTKLAGWPEPGAYADRLNAYVGNQQASGFQDGHNQSGQELSFGFQSGQSCMMCPSQIPCTRPKEGLLMVCHCKHPPAEAQTQDK